MEKELQKHKKSDKVKWVFTSIAFVLVFVMLAGLCMQVFAKNDKFKPSSWFEKTEKSEDNSDKSATGGLILPGEKQGNGVSLLSTPIPVELYDEYGISPLVESAYMLTAVLTPADSAVRDFTWSLAYVGGGSNVTEVTLSVSDSNPLQCTVSCNKPFATPIKISITYNEDDSITSSIQVDYIKRISSVTVSGFDSTKFNSGSAQTLSLNAIYGVGTVQGTLTINSCYGEFSEEHYLAMTDTGPHSTYYGRLDSSYYGDSYGFSSRSFTVSGSVLNLTIKSFWSAPSDYGWTSDAEEDVKACFCLVLNKDVLRACVNYTYSYSNVLTLSGTAYSAYGSLNLNNLRNKYTTVDDIDIDSPGIYF